MDRIFDRAMVSVAANQDYNVTQQLTDGIRMLQIQAHNATDGTIHLCHTSCVSPGSEEENVVDTLMTTLHFQISSLGIARRWNAGVIPSTRQSMGRCQSERSGHYPDRELKRPATDLV